MLPGKDGFAVVKQLRSAGHYVPVLMLTARSRPEDVLHGFEAGADDYLPKPFELQILLARLRGLLRRRMAAQPAQRHAVTPPTHEVLAFAGKRLDLEALELHVGDKKYQLTQMECDLLHYLVKNAGKAVSRKAILEDVWDLHEDTDTRAIDNFIVRLRRYLEDDPTKPKRSSTVRGVGYRLQALVETVHPRHSSRRRPGPGAPALVCGPSLQASFSHSEGERLRGAEVVVAHEQQRPRAVGRRRPERHALEVAERAPAPAAAAAPASRDRASRRLRAGRTAGTGSDGSAETSSAPARSTRCRRTGLNAGAPGAPTQARPLERDEPSCRRARELARARSRRPRRARRSPAARGVGSRS